MTKKLWTRWSMATILLAMVLLGILISPQVMVAQTKDQTSFRISRLETEVRGLRSQIQQLEAQLNRVQRNSRNDSPPPLPDVQPEATADQTQPGSDLLFDQLATLVIETRQDMFALEERMAEIEQIVSQTSEPF